MMEDADTYRTIAAPAQSLYKEKGSKFIGLAYPVDSEEDIKLILSSIRQEYFDARHYCYAYILDPAGTNYRANDDGEPNHSAGDPILGQIRSAQLSHLLVIVVRYFGGIKLGVSGLIQAYKTAAADVIRLATIVEKVETYMLQVHFSYEHMNAVMAVIKEYKPEIQLQNFNLACELHLCIRKTLAPAITQKLAGFATVLPF